MNFKGQGQIQQSAPLWNNHMVERGNTILDALEPTSNQKLICPEITISKTQYKILQRYHKK